MKPYSPPPANDQPALRRPADRLITWHQFSYQYDKSQPPVLAALDLTVEIGEFLLVIGASGAGKSTLLKSINGLVPHFHGGVVGGQVDVAGRDPLAAGPRRMSDLVGFVFQDPESQFVTEKVEDELAFAMENHNLPQTLMRKRIEEVLDQLSIAHLRGRAVNTLSGGERQRVAIGSALTLQPEILVLDEPTSQLDPQAAEEVLNVLHKLNQDLGLTIILSEHRLERVVQYADRICYLPGPGSPPVIGPPADVLAGVKLAPPLVELAHRFNWQPVPLTLKAARRFATGLPMSRQAPSDASTHSHNQRANDAPIVAEAEKIWFSQGRQEVLKGLSVQVRRGEFVALMGRNGSGKTTLLKHLVGLWQPDRGRVTVLGLDTARTDLAELTSQVGFVPQNSGRLLFNETVVDELIYTRKAHHLLNGQNLINRLLDRLDLSRHRAAYPRDLSVGERQRAALASILIAEPKLLLLDEPTRGLDYFNKEALITILKQLQSEGVTIIMATHDVELVAKATERVVIMGDGQIVVDGPVREVMSESLVFSSQISKLFRSPQFLTVEDVLRTYQAATGHG